MLSTFHNSNTSVVKDKKTQNNINKPNVIIDYVSHMGGVDRADHFISSYNFASKSLKWWRKLYFWLLEVSVVNSYILYNEYQKGQNKPPVVHKRYRKMLISELVGDVRNTNRKRGRPSSKGDKERLNGKIHIINKMPNNKHKDCAVCSNRSVKGGRKETVFWCETCPRNPGLHPENCFKLYHTQKNYKN